MADRNARLAALMDEGGFSHKSLARAVVVAAARSGEDITCDHTYVSRWLKGSIPRGDMPRFIADAIGRKLGRQLTIDDIGMGDAAVSAVQPDLGLDFADRPETVTDHRGRPLARRPRRSRTAGSSAAGLRRVERSFRAVARLSAGRRTHAVGQPVRRGRGRRHGALDCRRVQHARRQVRRWPRTARADSVPAHGRTAHARRQVLRHCGQATPLGSGRSALARRMDVVRQRPARHRPALLHPGSAHDAGGR